MQTDVINREVINRVSGKVYDCYRRIMCSLIVCRPLLQSLRLG